MTVLGGDADDSDTVDIFDVSLVAGTYPLTAGDPGWDARADITGDDAVDIFDVSVTAGNYLLSSPVPW